LYVQLVGLQLMLHALQALLPEAPVIFCSSLQDNAYLSCYRWQHTQLQVQDS
jgi:hypothetical protein